MALFCRNDNQLMDLLLFEPTVMLACVNVFHSTFDAFECHGLAFNILLLSQLNFVLSVILHYSKGMKPNCRRFIGSFIYLLLVKYQQLSHLHNYFFHFIALLNKLSKSRIRCRWLGCRFQKVSRSLFWSFCSFIASISPSPVKIWWSFSSILSNLEGCTWMDGIA